MRPSEKNQFQPLAMRMRPRSLDTFFGQAHLVSEGKALHQAITHGHLHSMILWGRPGTGNTTLPDIIATSVGARVERISAVLAGVKDIRDVVKRAELAQEAQNKATVLFVDEVHRFNKAQQDAFLPHVEKGTIVLIGATTENPSFQLNNALLSRARVYVLKPLSEKDLLSILKQALTDEERGLGARAIKIADELLQRLIQFSDGDARQSLNLLEIAADFSEKQGETEVVTETAIDEVLSTSLRRFDNGGEAFYDQISALHKSVRGSDPDAALYWFCRMIDGGCDPHYLARRVLRMASEDIGNADPRGLRLALDAWETYERLGSPEGELAIAQAIIYLASTAKSNAVYSAYTEAMSDVKKSGSLEVPLHLRNAPTRLMKELDYGKGYRYAHNEKNAFAAGEHYFPDEMKQRYYYQPVPRGLEQKIKAKLDRLRELSSKRKIPSPSLSPKGRGEE